MKRHNITKGDFKSTPKLNFRSLTLGHFLLFLFWPFGQMINAAANFRKPWAMTVMWLFFIYFGLVFVYSDPYALDGKDSADYARGLIEMHQNQQSIGEVWSSIYNVNTNKLDIFSPLLTWILAFFTGNPAFLFGIVAAVFGLFYVKNLWLIFNRIDVKVGTLIFLFMIIYALENPIWNINGVRWYTAAHVFLFGNLIYFLNGNRRGLLLSAVSILIHFSFMFPVALLLVWQFLPRKAWPLFGLYIATSLVSEVSFLGVRDLLSFLPNIFDSRVEGYINEEGAMALTEHIASVVTWHEVLAQNFSRWITYAWIILIFIKRKYWINKNKAYATIFMFALFLGSFANLASHIPSGSRYLTLSNVLFYGLFILLLGRNYLQITWFRTITVPMLTFVAIFKIRVGLDYIGFLTVAGNPLIAPLVESQKPLIEFIKDML